MLLLQLQLGMESERQEKWSLDGDLFGQLSSLLLAEMRHEVMIVVREIVHLGEEMSYVDEDGDPWVTLT